MTNLFSSGEVGSLWVIRLNMVALTLVGKITKKYNIIYSRGNISQNICSFTKKSHKVYTMRTIISALLFPLLLTAQAQQGIQRPLERLLDDRIFDAGDVSLMVYDLTADSLLFQHRAQKLVRPASVQKVLTSVVAIDRLGSDYTFDTELFKRQDSVSCNLFVKGYMDPLFSDADAMRMANCVERGAVIDTLFTDCSFSDSLYWGSGWVWDDNPYGYQPYLSPLMMCRGAVEVVVWPGAKGEAPAYKVVPESSFYTIVNEAVSNDPSAGKLTILRDWLDNSNVIRIRGNCTKRYKESLNMYKSADFFVAVLLEKLALRGVVVNYVQSGTVPADAELLFVNSRPIAAVVDEALMESDNLCAEALLLHLAARENVSPVSMAQGCRVVNEFVKGELGVTGEFSVADGSGLSVYNYLSADIVLGVLKHAYENKEIFDAFYTHLPHSGVSGTMQNRTKESAAFRKVRAKTGTVKGVCTLAGYAQAADGHLYAFVMLNDGLQKASTVRKWQDRVLEAICR